MTKIPTLTLETSVVIDAIEGTDPAAIELLDRAMKGEFDVAVTTRLEYELRKPEPSPAIRAFLANLRVLGAPGRWGVSKWGAGDYWVDRETTAAGSIDTDHIEAHIRSGGEHFVSGDKSQLNKARRRGVSALRPEEVLKRYPGSA